MALDFIKLVKGDSTIAQVGNYGFFKLAVETSGGGGGGSGDVSFSRIFSENSSATISAVSAEISANNMTSSQVAETYGWNLGDTKDITLSTGEVIQMQIIGFNHDEKSDGSGKAGITLQTVNIFTKLYNMNATNTASGGYTASKMKKETMPYFKGLLPLEWKNIIKLVNKKCAMGPGYSSSIISEEELFLLSEIEVFGTITNSLVSDEGDVYEYWSGKDKSDRIKYRDMDADGVFETSTFWWLRSCQKRFSEYFCLVSSSGGSHYQSASSGFGVSFAFCV